MVKVNYCPQNDTSLKERSNNKHCSRYPKCSGQQLVYHCVVSDIWIVEVCAPRNFITGHCCSIFDNTIGRVIEDYSNQCTTCPFQYNSDDSFKYGECFPPKRKKQGGNMITPSSNNTSAQDKGNPMVLISIVLGGITFSSSLAVAYRYRNSLATVCFRRKKRLESKAGIKDSLSIECKDLIRCERSTNISIEDEHVPLWYLTICRCPQ